MHAHGVMEILPLVMLSSMARDDVNDLSTVSTTTRIADEEKH
jgi:hypothetical protein